MIRKALLLILSIVLLVAAVAGCWNYVDVDTQFVVMGVVIDYDNQTEEYIMYTEIAKAKGGTSTELITRVESFRGATIFEASRNGIMKIGAKLYWGHTMVYVISEKVARDSISDVMSLLSRQTQIRSDLYVLVCDDSSVKDFFNFDDPIHTSISVHVYDLLMANQASGKYRSSPLFKVLQELSSDDVTLMLPYLKFEPMHLDETTSMEQKTQEDDKQQQQPEQDKAAQEEGKQQEETTQEGGQQDKESSGQGEQQSSGGEAKVDDILIVEGSAVFRKATMVGQFSEIDTRTVMIMKGEVSNRYVLTYEETKEIPSFSIEVIESKVSIEPEVMDDGILKVKVKFHVEGDLVEIQTLKDYIKDDRKKDLETAFNKMMSQEMHKSIERAQGLGSDVFGIAGVVHRKMPDYYKKVKFNWEEVFMNAEFLVQTELNISSSSLSMNPIRVGR